jgi:hypothetical protein
MATVSIVGIGLALIATFILPETAGRKLISLEDLEETPPG